MKTFDVQGVKLDVPVSRAFDFVADPANLPQWTSAFRRADAMSAEMETPQGTVAIRLKTTARREAGTIDWTMTFPDGAVATAFSRITSDGEKASIYSFVLMAPPVPLEALEGALEAQRVTLEKEMQRLKTILESR